MATDEALNEGLSRQIAARAMKSWRQYAAEVVDRLLACSEGRLKMPESPDVETGDERRSGKAASLTLSAADLKIYEVYAGRGAYDP